MQHEKTRIKLDYKTNLFPLFDVQVYIIGGDGTHKGAKAIHDVGSCSPILSTSSLNIKLEKQLYKSN